MKYLYFYFCDAQLVGQNDAKIPPNTFCRGHVPSPTLSHFNAKYQLIITLLGLMMATYGHGIIPLSQFLLINLPPKMIAKLTPGTFHCGCVPAITDYWLVAVSWYCLALSAPSLSHFYVGLPFWCSKWTKNQSKHSCHCP
jgi:hypothetical protein